MLKSMTLHFSFYLFKNYEDKRNNIFVPRGIEL